MKISVGIYTVLIVFFFLVVPGYIARRFFFHGEFSKQLSPSNKYLRNITYSLFVGISISLLLVFFTNYIRPETIDLGKLLTKFDANFINNLPNLGNKPEAKFNGLSSNIYKYYIPYLCLIYSISAILGYFANKLILLFNLDVKFKVFRFHNIWHYLFTGRIMRTKKLKNENNTKLKIKYTYLDVLVNNNSNQTLYSGLYADYALNPKEPSKLEKLYLLKAVREDLISNIKKEKEKISGTILAIMANTILNINCTYVYEKLEEKKNKIFLRKKGLISASQFLSTFLFALFVTAMVFNLKLIKLNFYNEILLSPLYIRAIWAFLFNILLGFLTPFEIDEDAQDVKFTGWALLVLRLLAALGIYFIIYKLGY